jgi:hypothetical protein
MTDDKTKENTTMNKQRATTLTFSSYTDFVVELVRREVGEVRLESGTRSKPVSKGPGAYLEYVVILTALDAGRNGLPVVLACTFQVGGCWDVFEDQHPENRENLRLATDVVEADLNHWGIIDVHPGVYAHDADWGYAVPDGLWHFCKQDGKAILVPEPAEGHAPLCWERSERVRQAMLRAGEVAR